MKLGLQTWGTDGDFMPFLALAIGLKKAGHDVTLAYTSVDGKDYSQRPDVTGIKLIRANGSVVIPSDFNPYAIDSRPGSFREYSKLLKLYFEPFTETMYEASEQLCCENELVIGHAVCHTLLTASQKHNVPRVSLVLVPLVVQSKHISPIGNDMGTFLNSMMWNLGDKISTALWFKQGRAIRKREGLPRIESLQQELFTSDFLTIVAASQVIAPRQSDWEDNIQITGFLNLPKHGENWKMPVDLRTFMDAGEPPIFMTFGSCMQFDLEKSTELLVEAARLTGRRTIIQSDWDQIQKPEDPNIFCVGSIPHSEIFPYCSLIVHHGGAGTTQAALLAGKPSVVVAHGFDQSYWANRLQRLEVGEKTFLRTSTTPNELANEINKLVDSPLIRSNAKTLQNQMLNENGVQLAIELIRKHLK